VSHVFTFFLSARRAPANRFFLLCFSSLFLRFSQTLLADASHDASRRRFSRRFSQTLLTTLLARATFAKQVCKTNKQKSWLVVLLCCATAGQEDPFELDSNLLLSSGRHGEDRKRQYFCTTMKHRYLAIWLTNCTWHCHVCSSF
jgi:hypothetical protein